MLRAITILKTECNRRTISTAGHTTLQLHTQSPAAQPLHPQSCISVAISTAGHGIWHPSQPPHYRPACATTSEMRSLPSLCWRTEAVRSIFTSQHPFRRPQSEIRGGKAAKRGAKKRRQKTRQERWQKRHSNASRRRQTHP